MPARLFNYALPPQRIRTFLVLFALALTSPLVVLAVFALNQMANLEEREIERRVLQVAQDLAGDVDRELESATVTLETLAISQALAERDFARFHDQAGRAVRREQAGILVVDDTFQQLLNTRVAFGTELPKTSDTETAQRVFDTKQRQISGLFMGKVSRQPVINVEVPVVDGEDVRLVLIMALDATRFEKMLQSQRLEARWITGITDNKGIIVARSERHADFVGKPLPQELLEQSRTAQGVFRATNVAGQQIVRATVRSQVAGWLVSATVPVADVEASRRRGQAFALAMIATALGLGAALAYMFATFMARPLQAATTCAAAVGRGEDVAPLKSPLVEANALTTRPEQRFTGASAAPGTLGLPNPRTCASIKEPACGRAGHGFADRTTDAERGPIRRRIRATRRRVGGVAGPHGAAELAGSMASRSCQHPFEPVRRRSANADWMVPHFFSAPMRYKTSALP